MIRYEDVKQLTNASYFTGYDFSEEIWNDTYRGPQENTVIDTWKRISHAASLVENVEKRVEIENAFFDILHDFYFVPGGRIMANIGIEGREGTTLFNCFIHHPSDIGLNDCDSIEGIYTLLKAQAHTLKSEGGYGINPSFIRPAGAYVYGIGSRTPGVLKFMELWDKSSEIITMGSEKVSGNTQSNEKRKIRKGAQMFVLSCFHPDIKEFITAKQTANRFTKFNMSVGISDEFMVALANDSYWNLRFPDTTHPRYKAEWFGDIEDWEEKGLPVVVYETVRAKELWELITKSTYDRNEPGVLFLGTVNRLNPLFYAEKIFATNPCGEIPNSTGVCDLGSLNLAKYIKIVGKRVEFDYKKFKEHVVMGVRFLDNVLDISRTPLVEYAEANQKKRRIGLGTMGLGSLHFMLGIRYGSQESLDLIKKIFKTKSETELLASAKLGKEKGSFPEFNKEKYFSSVWWKNLKIDSDIKKEIESIGCMRNSHRGMNAPTGNGASYALMASSGIEPVFTDEYLRWLIVSTAECISLRLSGFQFPDKTKSEWFETEHMKATVKNGENILKGTFNGVDYEFDKNRGLIKSVLIEDYGWKFAKEFYKENLDAMKRDGLFATTDSLTVDDHINTLRIIAHYTDQANSKTVNIPNDYSYEQFQNLYIDAYKSNIKGITTYRAGTMTAVLEKKDDKSKTLVDVNGGIVPAPDAPKRPKTVDADIYVVTVKGEKFVIAIGMLNGQPYEIFGGALNGLGFKFQHKKGKIEKVKRGHYKLEIGEEIEVENFSSQFTPTAQILFRMVSTNLRHGVPLTFIVEQLQKSEDDMFSMTAAAARVLKKYIVDGAKAQGTTCPDCGSTDLIYQDGCMSCKACNWSKCQ